MSDSKNKKEQDLYPFDQMMFGRRKRPRKEDEDKEPSDSESIDLFDSVGLVQEIYQQLSPVVKDFNEARKKFTKK